MTLNRRANRRRFANVGTSWSFSQRLTVAVCTPTNLATSDWLKPARSRSFRIATGAVYGVHGRASVANWQRGGDRTAQDGQRAT